MSRADDLIGRLQDKVERLDRESQNLSNQLGSCGRDLAALKAQQPSGVVLPEPLKRGDEGGSGEYGAAMIRGFNACLREVARLNPCRAQAVPDGLLISSEGVEHLKHARRELTRMDRAPLYIRQALAEKITAMLAAAPSAKKEG